MAKIIPLHPIKTIQQKSSFLQKLKKKFIKLKREKHEFNYDNPIYGGTDVYTKDKAGNLKEYMAEGYICLKCGEAMWIGYPMIKSLCGGMQYCGYKESKKNG